MEIKRDIYLNRLIVRKNNGFIKVITGIRRSGKSYLLNTLFYNHLLDEGIGEDHIIRFAFDSAEDLIKIGTLDFGEVIKTAVSYESVFQKRSAEVDGRHFANQTGRIT